MRKIIVILLGLILWTGIHAQQPAGDTTQVVNESIQQVYGKENLDTREAILLQKLNAEQLMTLEKQRLDYKTSNQMPLPALAIVLICLAPFVMVVLIVFFENKSKRTKQQQRYDLYMKSLELGQPLPDKMFEEPEKKSSSRLQNGLVWLGVGIALFLMTFFIDNNGILYVGIIPAFVGLGILIAYFIEKPKKEETPTVNE